jgi:hypothetical protein
MSGPQVDFASWMTQPVISIHALESLQNRLHVELPTVEVKPESKLGAPLPYREILAFPRASIARDYREQIRVRTNCTFCVRYQGKDGLELDVASDSLSKNVHFFRLTELSQAVLCTEDFCRHCIDLKLSNIRFKPVLVDGRMSDPVQRFRFKSAVRLQRARDQSSSVLPVPTSFDPRTWLAQLGSFIEEARKLPRFKGSVRSSPGVTRRATMYEEWLIVTPMPETYRRFVVCASATRFSYTMRLEHLPAELTEVLGKRKTLEGKAAICRFSRLASDLKRMWTLAEETWIAQNPEERDLWCNSLPIISFPNGDYVALDLCAPQDDPPVVYLRHDGGSRVLAPSFSGFLEAWARLCYIGPDISRLEPFINPDTGFLDPDSDNAKALRNVFAPQNRNGEIKDESATTRT